MASWAARRENFSRHRKSCQRYAHVSRRPAPSAGAVDASKSKSAFRPLSADTVTNHRRNLLASVSVVEKEMSVLFAPEAGGPKLIGRDKHKFVQPNFLQRAFRAGL